MEIRRLETRESLTEGEALIEVLATGPDAFVVIVELSDDTPSYRTGPFPTAKMAEAEGVELAEQGGVKLLYVVTSDA